ncbi:MAG TPA: hypothetical protein VLJ60_00990 [bacterium]|nr:hypothetical protein [bacterium]
MKVIKIFMVFVVLFIISGCEDEEKVDCGETLTWKLESSANSVAIDFKDVAGEQCSNYSDYYEADLSQVIGKIHNMKFVLNRHCYEMVQGENDPEEVEVDCPEFVPETIEFKELTECSFSTPQIIPEGAVVSYCNNPEMRLRFKVENTSQTALWTFYNVENPGFKAEKEYSLGTHAFDIFENGIFTAGYFKDENLTTAGIVFTWTVGEEEKTLEFSATVETKE